MSFSLARIVYSLLFLAASTEAAIGSCWEPSPAFPPPKINASLFESSKLAEKFDLLIANVLNSTSSSWSWENSSFAIQLTSGTETIWSSYYTAPSLGNYSDGEPTPVSGNTAFRIASCSKTFTVYALLLEKGIGLEDPITKYLPGLTGERDERWGVPVDWDSITIRALASQMSGIGRGNGNDLTEYQLDGWDPVNQGLPKIASNDTWLKPCGGLGASNCTAANMIQTAKEMSPIFSPNDRSTYSNIAFSLLGLALENATGKEFSEIIKTSILTPLHMTNTTTTKPNDSYGIIPVGPTDWAEVLGTDNPSGGIYSTTNDLSKYLRSILTSSLLSISTTNAWMKPHSWTSSRTSSAYGMPWEILRTTKAAPDSHPIDVITKGGALGGYYSTIALLPEYQIGVSILTATPNQLVELHLRELVITEVISSFDKLARERAKEKYAGFYGHLDEIFEDLEDSFSIKLEVDDGPGLLLKSWKLNNTDFLPTYGFLKQMPKNSEWEARLIPTNFVTSYPISDEEETPQSIITETWRLTAIPKAKEDEGIFGDYCFTDVDGIAYGGFSLEEFVFYSFESTDRIENVFISGARVLLWNGRNMKGNAVDDLDGKWQGWEGADEGKQQVLGEE